MSQEIAIGKNQLIFVKLEGTPGTAEVMTTSECLLITSDMDAKQARAFNEDNQKRLTVGKVDRLTFFYEAGTFTFSIYNKASGAAGTAPTEGVILEGLFGTEAIVGSTSVTYSQQGIDATIKTYTILFQKGHDVVWLTGCVFDKGEWNIKADNSDDGIVGFTVTGMYMQESRAGYDTVAVEIEGDPAPVATFEVDNAKRFIGTPFIEIGTDDNSGAGYQITAINYTTNIITVTPSISTDQSVGAVVKGWIPAQSEAGTLMHGRYSSLTEDDGSGAVARTHSIEANITYMNNIQHNNALKNDSEYPSVSAYTLGDREVTFSMTELFEKSSSRFNYDAKEQTNLAFVVPFSSADGGAAGSNGQFNIAKVRIDVPERTGDLEMTNALSGVCLETTSLNDAITLVFT